MTTTVQTEQWVSKSEACRQCHISIVKLRAIIAKHQLGVRQSTRDNRKMLVDLYKVRRYLGPD